MPSGLVTKCAKDFHEKLRYFCLLHEEPQGYGQTWKLADQTEISDVLRILSHDGKKLQVEAPRTASMTGLHTSCLQRDKIILKGTEGDAFTILPRNLYIHVNNNPMKTYVAAGFVEEYRTPEGEHVRPRLGEPAVITAQGSWKPRMQLIFSFPEEHYRKNAERLKAAFGKTLSNIEIGNRYGLKLMLPSYDLEREVPALSIRMFITRRSKLEDAVKFVEKRIMAMKETESVHMRTYESAMGPITDIGVLFETP